MSCQCCIMMMMMCVATLSPNMMMMSVASCRVDATSGEARDRDRPCDSRKVGCPSNLYPTSSHSHQTNRAYYQQHISQRQLRLGPAYNEQPTPH
jgi:hypothetical protein